MTLYALRVCSHFFFIVVHVWKVVHMVVWLWKSLNNVLFSFYSLFLWTLNVSSLCNLLLPRQSIVIFLYKIVLRCLWSNHYYHGNTCPNLMSDGDLMLLCYPEDAHFISISAQPVCYLLFLACQVSCRNGHVEGCYDNIKYPISLLDLLGQSCDSVSNRYDNSALTSDFCWFARSVRWLERLWLLWQQCPN